MRSIRKFVGCVKVAAGLGAALVVLGLSVQTATARVVTIPTEQTSTQSVSLSAGCLGALQAIRDAIVNDRQEDAEEFRAPNPSGEAAEDGAESTAFAPLISNLRTACSAEIAAVKAGTPVGTTQPTVPAQCTAAVQAWKSFVKTLWAQRTPPTAAQQAQLRQLGQAVKSACGWAAR